jgi:predicted DCC family thiol-disulfide oxidoreductase YuxK
MTQAATLHVIYDGRCGFCLRALRICRALDWRDRLAFHDSHDRTTIEKRFAHLAGADFDSAMYAVDDDGRAFRGFFAIRRIAWETPPLWLVLPLFYAPGMSIVGPRVYGWIARNRHRFGCGSDECALRVPSR